MGTAMPSPMPVDPILPPATPAAGPRDPPLPAGASIERRAQHGRFIVSADVVEDASRSSASESAGKDCALFSFFRNKPAGMGICLAAPLHQLLGLIRYCPCTWNREFVFVIQRTRSSRRP